MINLRMIALKLFWVCIMAIMAFGDAMLWNGNKQIRVVSRRGRLRGSASAKMWSCGCDREFYGRDPDAFPVCQKKNIVWGQKNSLESECKTNKTSRKRKRNQLQTGLFGDSLSWADTLTLAKGLRASEQCFALYPLSAGKHSYDSWRVEG